MMSEARLFFCGWLLLPVVSCKFLHKFFYSRNKNRLHVTAGFQKRAHTVSHMCNDACIGVAFLRSKTELRQLRNRGIGLALRQRCNESIVSRIFSTGDLAEIQIARLRRKQRAGRIRR